MVQKEKAGAVDKTIFALRSVRYDKTAERHDYHANFNFNSGYCMDVFLGLVN